MWLHCLIFFGGMVVGATVGVVGFGALLAAVKSEMPVPVEPLQVPADWIERERELRQQ